VTTRNLPWGKNGRHVRLTTPLPSVSRLSRKCGIVDLSGPPWRGTGIALSLSFMPLCFPLEYYNQKLLFLLSQKYRKGHCADRIIRHAVSWNVQTSLTQLSVPEVLDPFSFFLCVLWFLAPCTVHVLPRLNCVEQKFAHESSIGIFLHGKTLDSNNRSHIRNGVQVTCRHALPTANHAEQPSRFVRVKVNHVLRTHQDPLLLKLWPTVMRPKATISLKYNGNFLLSRAHERLVREWYRMQLL
jgi:hypothetical protein